uniref:DNA gyrase inhibitor YacG n=1 Tax=Schlesneria paludicola TaxID=360056 RepID=A0A7C2PFW4_9PLAN
MGKTSPVETRPAESPCPICHRPVAAGDPQSPFCSPRCRQVDLIRWADGKYVIARPLTGDDLDELAADDLASGEADYQDEV